VAAALLTSPSPRSGLSILAIGRLPAAGVRKGFFIVLIVYLPEEDSPISDLNFYVPFHPEGLELTESDSEKDKL
jgi:hypothetical protein